MRKYVVLYLVLFLLGLCLFAQEPASAPAKAKLLPADRMDLDMRYSTEMKRLYVQADFTVAGAKLDTLSYFGVFLNRGAKIQSVTINNRASGHYFMQGLVPDHFDPVLPNAELVASDAPARFHGIVLSNFAQYGETVAFRIMYYLDVPEFAMNDMNMLCAGFAPESFWYPRNVMGRTAVNLNLHTTQFTELMLGNQLVAYKDTGFQRTHSSMFFDMPAQPLAFRLIRN